MRRLAVPLFALAACGGAPASRVDPLAAPSASTYRGAKKLVVLLIIDQLPQWAFAQKAPALTQGFDRALREGQWFIGEHPTPATLTAVGHALIGTGEPPYHSGIIANEWWDRTTGKMTFSVEGPNNARDTHHLRVPGLGDSIAAAKSGAKAVAISLKDRAALLPLGHAGLAVWYDKTQVSFISSAPAAWLPAFNTAHPVTAHLTDVWTPLDAARLAQLSGAGDAEPGEIGEKDFGPTFPHALAKTKFPADAIFAAPIGNELVLDVARAAIDGEQLGTDATTDLLVLSLSAHDYVGHGWGQESWEAWDMMLRLDASLAELMQSLDAKVGAGQWSMLITSDHGASPMPEKVRGGRMNQPDIGVAANNAAATELGSGTWVARSKYPFIWFTPAFFAAKPVERGKAMEKVLRALRAFPGIATADRTATFSGDCEKRTGDAHAICMMIDPERAGEVFFLPAKGWIWQEPDEPLATAHGSWQDYDRQVPVIMLPFGRTAHERAMPTGSVDMVRIATVLAGWLGVTPPTSLTPRAASAAGAP